MMILSWGSPVGLGVFLAGLGVLFWGISRLSSTGNK